MYHNPVMLNEAIEGLAVTTGGTYVDATFGGGGHAAAILDKLGDGRLIAFDQDDEAANNLPEDDRILFLNHNFRYIKNFLKYYGYPKVDGILADLGVSSHQFDKAERGFSTRYDSPLDMRMNKESTFTAKNVLNEYDTKKLADVFFLYGEIKNARKIADIIAKQRSIKPLETTGQLTDLLKPMAPKKRENKYMAQVFQALRIEVNAELDALKELLEKSVEVLKEGGRLVVISYHSLEDRLVKNFMKSGRFDGKQEKDFYGHLHRPLMPVGKLQTPCEEELATNNRARSARFRVAVKQ